MRHPMHSIEGKPNVAGIIWKPSSLSLQWIGLRLLPILQTTGKDPYIDEALTRNTARCRILWRPHNGGRLWFLQPSPNPKDSTAQMAGFPPCKSQEEDGQTPPRNWTTTSKSSTSLLPLNLFKSGEGSHAAFFTTSGGGVSTGRLASRRPATALRRCSPQMCP